MDELREAARDLADYVASVGAVTPDVLRIIDHAVHEVQLKWDRLKQSKGYRPVGRRRQPLSPTKARAMAAQGKTVTAIAREYRMSRTTVYKLLRAVSA